MNTYVEHSMPSVATIYVRVFDSRLHDVNKIPWHSFEDPIKKYQ
jgi:hypothetical protein